ncbi:MAG TPA: TetR/AcrR family transcriptional regulator [Dermatophilaceae bacterium]|nr:TetR/AcrR family transcriptional regulator [Dermatophilaceae bacterium]
MTSVAGEHSEGPTDQSTEQLSDEAPERPIDEAPERPTDGATDGAPADGRTTRWNEHRQNRRRELVEATLRAIRLHGAGVGMDDVAAVAGTSKTVIYRHFSDRAGLYQAVAEHVDRTILRDLAQAVGDESALVTGSTQAGDPRVDPRAVIGAAIDSYLRLVERDPEVYRFIVAAPLLERSPVGAAGSSEAMSDHVAERIAHLIGAALSARGGEAKAAQVWGPAVVGMVRAAADRWLARGASTSGMSRTSLADHLTDLAWGGLSSAWPPLPGPAQSDIDADAT